jgi:hypothetical protein
MDEHIKKAVETILKPEKDMEPERLKVQTQLALKHLESLMRKKVRRGSG